MGVWYLYLIETEKRQIYTGITTDVQRRFKEHLGVFEKTCTKGAKFFRANRPLRVIHQEAFVSRSDASKREYEVKRMDARSKRLLIRESVV